MRKSYTLKIIPEKNGTMHEVRLHAKLIFIFCLFFITMIGVVAYIFYEYIQLNRKFFHLEGIKAKVQTQKKTIDSFSKLLEANNFELDYLKIQREKLRLLITPPELVKSDELLEKEKIQDQRLEKIAKNGILKIILPDENQFESDTPDSKLKIESFISYLEETENGKIHQPDIWPIRGLLLAKFNDSIKISNSYKSENLTGVVLAIHSKAIIKAPAHGIVISVEDIAEKGIHLRLYHSSNLVTEYKYLSNTALEIGMRVAKNQRLGTVANNSIYKTPVLEYSLFFNGIPQDPIQFITHSILN